MLTRGNKLEEVEQILNTHQYYSDVPADSISLKLMIKNEEGEIWRLKYKDTIYIQRNWQNELREQTQWLFVKDGVVEGVYGQYRIAKIKIGIYTIKKRPEKIIRDQATHEFDMQICRDAREANDKGYCGVRAYCNITHTPYLEGRELCRQYGWSHSGMRTYALITLLKDQGYTVENNTEYIRERAKTIKTFEEQGFRETYLIHVSCHFVSSVNGVITDHTYGRKKIIESAYRISK